MTCPFLVKCPIGIDIIRDAIGNGGSSSGGIQRMFCPKDYTISKLKTRLICYMLLCFGLIALLWFIFTFYDLHEKPMEFFEDYFFIGGGNKRRNRSIRQCPLKRCPIMRPKIKQEPYLELFLKEIPMKAKAPKEIVKETPKEVEVEVAKAKDSKDDGPTDHEEPRRGDDFSDVSSNSGSGSDSDDIDSVFNSDSEGSVDDIVKVGINYDDDGDEEKETETVKEKKS